MSYQYLEAAKQAQFDAWLKTAPPDDRHACAQSWNWDSGNSALRWMIEQPDCEQATVLWIFWYAEPTYYAEKFKDRAEAEAAASYELKNYDFVHEILQRWRAGVYQNNSIKFDPDSEASASMYDVERWKDHAELSIPESMVKPVGRREAKKSEQFSEGIPFSILGR